MKRGASISGSTTMSPLILISWNWQMRQKKPTRHARPWADQIKDFVNEGHPLIDQASVYSDLLTAAIENVDWFEIADSFLEE